MCVGQKVEKRVVSSHAIMEICCTAEMTHLGYIEFCFFSPWNSLGINGAALLCTSVYFSFLDNPFFFSVMAAPARKSSTARVDSMALITSSPTCRSEGGEVALHRYTFSIVIVYC